MKEAVAWARDLVHARKVFKGDPSTGTLLIRLADKLGPGGKVPGLRWLARELGWSLGKVHRIKRRLEYLRLAKFRPGRGDQPDRCTLSIGKVITKDEVRAMREAMKLPPPTLRPLNTLAIRPLNGTDTALERIPITPRDVAPAGVSPTGERTEAGAQREEFAKTESDAARGRELLGDSRQRGDDLATMPTKGSA